MPPVYLARCRGGREVPLGGGISGLGRRSGDGRPGALPSVRRRDHVLAPCGGLAPARRGGRPRGRARRDRARQGDRADREADRRRGRRRRAVRHARGDVLVGAQALRSRGRTEAARLRLRRRQLGGGHVPRPRRAHCRLVAGCADPDPLRRQARAARPAARLERRQAQCDHCPARAARRDGGRAATADLSSLRVPPTIQALLAARLDRLAVDERAVIERAAVEGKVFHRGAVAALAPDPLRARVGEQLLALVRKELIRPERTSFAGDDAFRFRHILIRDAAYDALPKELRAELHERFADWLEKQAGDRAGEYEEILGYHLEQAWRYRGELGPLDEHGQAVAERAGERLAAAGKRAFTRGDMQAASSLLARAAELLPREGAQHMSVLVALGAALEATGELTRATVVLDEAVELALRTGDTRIELRARLERAALALVMSGEREQPHSEAAELAEQAIPVFEAAQDHEGLARAWEMIGNRHWSACHYGARAEALERALVHAERAGDRRLEAEIYQGLGLSIGSGTAPLSEAIDRCEQLLARAHGHPALEAAVRGPLAVLYAGRGRFDEARRAYRSSLETFRELGLKLRIGLATIFGGRLEMLAGDPIAAERELRVGYELLRESGEKNVFSTLTGQLAEVMCAQGRYQDAARLVQEAREASSPDDVISEILWRRTEATLKARGGEYETAENLREALRLFEQKENTVAAAEAKNLLAEIAVESAISRKPR